MRRSITVLTFIGALVLIVWALIEGDEKVREVIAISLMVLVALAVWIEMRGNK